MQFRRFALAVLVVVALAAILWFAQHDARGSAVPPPLSSEPTASHAPASALEASTPAAREAHAPETARDKVQDIPDEAFAPSAPATEAEAGLLVRVLQPSGAPLGHALLEAVAHSGGAQVRYVPNPVDAAGCRRIQLGVTSTIDLRASDREGRWAPAFALAVSGGTREVALRLEDGRRHTLAVVDEEGKPIERFAWRLLDEREYLAHSEGRILFDENGRVRSTWLGTGVPGSFDPQSNDFVDHPGGLASYVAGTRPIVLQVEGEEYEQAQLGPLLAADLPGPARIVLQRAPGIRGRVLHSGKGVGGAWVHLLAAADPERETLLDGFPSRFEYPALASTTCSADGSFRLPLRAAGEFVVQAGADALSVVESARRHIELHSGLDGLELELPTPGEIHGRILLPPGASPRDWIVGASQCNGLLQSVRPNDEARFQLIGVSPGAWLLRCCASDVPACGVGSISYRETPEQDPIAYTCVVRSGESTQVAIDLRQPRSSRAICNWARSARVSSSVGSCRATERSAGPARSGTPTRDLSTPRVTSPGAMTCTCSSSEERLPSGSTSVCSSPRARTPGPARSRRASW